ncbi:MAG: hypothetical protein HY905_20960 [Deltaproteobacteria bacterium]|nr:hypothetical protein [Deltaproteobacteria bacterium]
MIAERFMSCALAAARGLEDRRVYRVLMLLSRGISVESSEAAKTARIGVSGSGRFRIEVSPSFVRRYVRTDQDALFLLLHELMHRVHGDFAWRPPSGDPSHEALNVVLDLLVNAHLMRLAFPVSPPMLSRLYPADRFPWNLLLPPNAMAEKGRRRDRRWDSFACRHDALVRSYAHPEKRARLEAVAEEQFRRSGAPDPPRLSRLYLSGWLGDMPRTMFLQEALPFLEREFPSIRALLSQVVVLGNHDDGPWLDEARELLGLGPQAGHGDRIADESLGRIESAEDRAFFEAVRRAICRDERQPTVRVGTVPAPGVIGDLGRREAIFLACGVMPAFYRTTATAPEDSYDRVHIYLDVSGSTADWQRLFYGLTMRLGDRIGSPIHLFSNVVEPLTMAELAEGVSRTTGGTDFDCVISHALDRDVSRILVVTDGQAGLDPVLRARAAARRLQVFSVLTSDFHRDSPIIQMAQEWWVLPEGMRSGQPPRRRHR